MSSARNSQRRRRNRGRFNLLFKVLSVVALFLALTMGATVFFKLEQVIVAGNIRYTAQEVEKASGLQMGENLFRINKNQIFDNIRHQLPYVEELSILRKWPSTIVITVKEWDAVARVDPTQLPEREPTEEGEEEEEKPLKPAKEGWLISVGGRLLEPVGGNKTAIEVEGLSILSPRAGTQLAVPREQQDKLDTLLSLLAVLEEQGLTEKVSEIDLSSATQLVLRYDGRFWVKLPMGGDYSYLLRALETVLPDWDNYEKGTFDLTRDKYAVIFSPD